MSQAENYRAFARECMRWAERTQISIEHREALLDMATTWAQAAAQLDYQFALIGQFDDLARKARKNLRAGSEGSEQTLQKNASGQTKQTDDIGGIDVLQSDRASAAGNDESLAELLKPLVQTAIEKTGGTARAAFYVADASGSKLHHVTGMTQAYARRIDGFAIGPQSLACGLPASMRKAVITPDIIAEPRSQPWLWLAKEADYRACWSFPVETPEGKTVGTFAIYHKEPTEPTPHDLDLASALTLTAATIISPRRPDSQASGLQWRHRLPRSRRTKQQSG
jgi:hypothetical protein